MSSAFIPYARQSIDSSDITAVSESLKNEMITRGPLVEQFEKAVAEYCGAKYAVAFSSASTALLGAYQAAQTNQRDRIICTPNTFVTSVSSGLYANATPTFVDIDLDNGAFNIDHVLYTLEKPSTQGKSIIVPVHFAGIAVDMQRLDDNLQDPNTIIIEDAAHAIGSRYKDGQRVGSCAWSHMTVFSFHPAKTMTTGEGGIVTTNDDELYNRLKCMRNSGIERQPERMEAAPKPWYYEVQELSSNFNMTEFQAALGISQLNRLDSFVEKRRQLTAVYRERLGSCRHIRLFNPSYDVDTCYHLFVAQINFAVCKTTREQVMRALHSEGIGTQVHYIPVYRHPYMQKICGQIEAYFPAMEEYYAKALTLPLYFDLTSEQVHKICDRLLKILKIPYTLK